MPKVKVVRLQVLTIAPDPVQYKPYNPTFGGDNLYIEVPVDEDDIEILPDERVVISMRGFQSLLIKLSNMIDDANDTRQNTKLKKYQRSNAK